MQPKKVKRSGDEEGKGERNRPTCPIVQDGIRPNVGERNDCIQNIDIDMHIGTSCHLHLCVCVCVRVMMEKQQQQQQACANVQQLTQSMILNRIDIDSRHPVYLFAHSLCSQLAK